MTDGNVEKETRPADPLAETNAPTNSEPIEPAAADGPLPPPQDEIGHQKDSAPTRAEAGDIKRTQSHATEVSVLTRTTSRASVPPQSKPWYKQPNPLRWGGIPPVPKEREVSREHNAGWLSRLTFQWMAPFMSVGYKRPLEQGDIWTVNPDRAADLMTDKFKASFHRRVEKGEKYPVLWALHETFFFEFWMGGFCQFCSSIFQVMSPFTLRFLIQFAQQAWEARQRNEPPPHLGAGIGLVIGITIMQILQSLGVNHFIYRGMMIGGQVRAVLIGMIFEKSMVISGRARAGGEKPKNDPVEGNAGEKGKENEKGSKKKAKNAKDQLANDGTGWSNGKIVNLMSVDTYRVDQASALFHMIWTAPLTCIITLVVLLINLTYSALAGFALLVIGVPVLTRAVRSLFRRRTTINKITDRRVGLTQEILSSVRFVKFFGWESAFLERLKDIRGKEIHAIQILLAIRNAINAVSMSLPIYASMLSFITYSQTHPNLPAAQVFSSLALFNGLRMPLNLLPLVIGQVVDAWQSIQRCQAFLLSEEQDDPAIWKEDMNAAVAMNDASFTWERTPTQESDKAGVKGKPEGANTDDSSTLVEEREPFKLQDLSFEIGRNELVAVIGGVGSGKTSLLSALAGDMRKTSGDVLLGASRAFCPQYAWIQNATLRENILFGKAMDQQWYHDVIQA